MRQDLCVAVHSLSVNNCSNLDKRGKWHLKVGYCTLWEGFLTKLFTEKFIVSLKFHMYGGANVDFKCLCMNLSCGDVTHVCVGVLSLGLGQWGVTVRAVVFTEVIGSLGVWGDQQLLDVSLWRRGKNNQQKPVQLYHLLWGSMKKTKAIFNY